MRFLFGLCLIIIRFIGGIVYPFMVLFGFWYCYKIIVTPTYTFFNYINLTEYSQPMAGILNIVFTIETWFALLYPLSLILQFLDRKVFNYAQLKGYIKNEF